jgi:alkanesulfonate monooxygenase SsuD/methylene tetrahydromethanopterin reductase-like flavin-dependent oxidoreductase (luciferase family)
MWAMTGESDATYLEETIEDVVLADSLGYDSIWLAEHHYVRNESFYSRLPDPEILIARLISETKTIRLATGIKILYLDDPARTVERLRLLNILSGGRVLFGVGQGSPDEMGVSTLTNDERRAGFRERLEEFGTYLESGMAAGDLTLTPEIDLTAARTVWVGARDPLSIALAARFGMNFIVGEAELGKRQALLTEGYRSSGGRGEMRGARLVCVAETDEEALAAARAPGRELFDRFSLGPYYGGAVDAGLISAEPVVDDDDALRRIEYVAGSPETVVEQLLEYVTTTGVTALNILVQSPGMARDAARRTLSLFMSDVAGHLLAALEANNAIAVGADA